MTYQEALDALRQANPDHILLRMLGLNESAGNRLILERELAKYAPDEVDEPPIGDQVTAEEPENPDDVEDEYLQNLRRQQSDLFAARRAMSNSFHQCASDSQRARVSEDIQSIQRRIEYVRRQIKEYKESGVVPAPDEKYPVPADPFRLLSLQRSLRASISRKSKDIRLIGEEAAKEVPGAEERLAKAETKMRELQNHLKHVDKAIQDRNIQSG